MSPSANEALGAFYAEHRQQLYTYAVSITRQREAAEDAIHQAFYHVLRRGAPPAELRPFVFRCVRNAALDGVRRAGSRNDSVFDDDAATGEASAPGSRLSRAELDQFLTGLSSDEHEAIVLRFFGGLSFREIAELRAVPLDTAASWYRRGMDKLRAKLTPATR